MRITDILGIPFFYNSLQAMLTGHSRRVYVNDYVKPKTGERIMDLGCGTGNMLPFFPDDVEYVGVDLSQAYIDDAKKKHKDRGTFICSSVDEVADQEPASFDIVIVGGLLHHIEDEVILKMLNMVNTCLKPGGRYVNIEPAYVDGQATFAKWMLNMDRGEFIRKPPEYVALLEQVFENVTADVRHDLMRVPYTHCILQGTPTTPA